MGTSVPRHRGATGSQGGRVVAGKQAPAGVSAFGLSAGFLSPPSCLTDSPWHQSSLPPGSPSVRYSELMALPCHVGQAHTGPNLLLARGNSRRRTQLGQPRAASFLLSLGQRDQKFTDRGCEPGRGQGLLFFSKLYLFKRKSDRKREREEIQTFSLFLYCPKWSPCPGLGQAGDESLELHAAPSRGRQRPKHMVCLPWLL